MQKFETLDKTFEQKIVDDNEMLKMANDGNFDEWQHSLQDAQRQWDKRIKKIKEDLDLRLKIEIQEIEERLNSHINTLLKQHEKDYNEISE